ncbi:MAG: hypothetical protein ACO1OD_09165, partial [Croceibacterium sp.]
INALTGLITNDFSIFVDPFADQLSFIWRKAVHAVIVADIQRSATGSLADQQLFRGIFALAACPIAEPPSPR